MNRKLSYVVMVMVLVAFGMSLSSPIVLAKHPNQGYIYGKVTTRGGNVYTGILRWNTDEEVFWDDLFHSNKDELPYADYRETSKKSSKRDVRKLEREIVSKERKLEQLEKKEAREKKQDLREKLEDQMMALEEELMELEDELDEMDDDGRYMSILGGSLNIRWDDWSGGSRLFVTRFGDIEKIEVIGGDDAELTMRNGEVYTVSGYANDVGATILINDDTMGEVKLNWKRIDTIEFMPTPSDVEPRGYRMHGTCYTDAGEFIGYIQWDKEEALSSDELDGDSEDGDLAIKFGKIRSIERRSRSSAWVELKDGRRMQLEGSNDIDNSNRGICVEDERYGRVTIPWDSFDKLVFSDKGNSGRGYNDYVKPYDLKGSVTDASGKKYTGKIVFDLDEAQSWEMFNGDKFDVEYDVPFEMIKSIQPRGSRSCSLEYFNGETVRLEGGQDASSSNDGILVFEKKDDPVYIEWDDVEVIEFTK
jgi:hypothetical protein